MLGISHSTIGVTELLIDRNKFQIGIIDKTNKVGVVDSYNEFIKHGDKRTKCLLINGCHNLKNIPCNKNIKYIIFDAPQILVKYGIEIWDASAPTEGMGTWNLFKKTPIELNNKITKMDGGYDKSIIESPSKYNIKNILKGICEDLSKPKQFKEMVAKYIFGMVKTNQWQEKILLLKNKIDKEKFDRLIGWLGTFEPDALCTAYMDCVLNAKGLCESYYKMIKNNKDIETLTKKFNNVAKKACFTADANFEDFAYLAKILPPNPIFSEKFLFPIPKYMISFRKKYPLISSNKTDSKLIRNT